MNILQRIKFALKYDILPIFIVVPAGRDFPSEMQFLHYEDAEAFVKQEKEDNPQFGEPAILVRVRSNTK